MTVPTNSVSQVNGVEILTRFEIMNIKGMEKLESMGTEWKDHDAVIQNPYFYKECRNIVESQTPKR